MKYRLQQSAVSLHPPTPSYEIVDEQDKLICRCPGYETGMLVLTALVSYHEKKAK